MSRYEAAMEQIEKTNLSHPDQIMLVKLYAYLDVMNEICPEQTVALGFAASYAFEFQLICQAEIAWGRANPVKFEALIRQRFWEYIDAHQ